jgi:hypothetical protein
MRPKTAIENKNQRKQSTSNNIDNKHTQLKPIEIAFEIAQSKLRKFVHKNVSLVDEFIHDKHEEDKSK